jgi:hypothetical protein
MLFALLRKLRNMTLVIAIASAAVFAYVVLHTGWRYQDIAWEQIRGLQENLGQPGLPPNARGRFVRLHGQLGPFNVIPGENESGVMMVPVDDPSHAAWAEIGKQLDDFESVRPGLEQLAGSTVPDAMFEAKINSIRGKMLALNKLAQARTAQNRTDLEEMQASVLRLEYQETVNASALRRAIHAASTWQRDLTDLQLRLSRKPAELLSATGILAIFRDGGTRAAEDSRAMEDARFSAGTHLDFGQQQKQLRERMDFFAKQVLRIPPTATMLKNDRAQLKRILRDCTELASSVRGMLPVDATVEGRLQVADTGLREKYRQMSGREPPRFILLAGAAAPDRSLWPLLWISGVAIAVAVILSCFRMRRVRTADPAPLKGNR